MASEDSDQFASGLASVHRLSDLRDLNETFAGPVTTVRNELNAVRKPSRSQTSLPSAAGAAERTALSSHVGHPAVSPTYRYRCSRWLSYRLLHQTFPTPKNDWRSCRESRLRAPCVTTTRALPGSRSCSLFDPPDHVAGTKPMEKHPSPSNETDHPSALLDQSFLLIVRARHVVTIARAFPIR